MHVEKRKISGNEYFFARFNLGKKRKQIYLGKKLPVDFLPFVNKRKQKKGIITELFGKGSK